MFFFCFICSLPDRHQGDEAKAIADTRFKQIGEAYQVLNDPRKRQQYDSGQVGRQFLSATALLLLILTLMLYIN